MLLAALLAAGLAGIHVFAGRLRFVDVTPRSRWLSAASGVSVAYVFVHILPRLGSHDEIVGQALGSPLGFVEHHVYLVAMVGLVTFYGLERMVRSARARRQDETSTEATGAGAFRLHVASFGAYNALIGYLLLHREEPGVRSLLLFFAAMAVHFLVNDYGLRKDHEGRYDRVGRWLLGVAPLGPRSTSPWVWRPGWSGVPAPADGPSPSGAHSSSSTRRGHRSSSECTGPTWRSSTSSRSGPCWP